MTRRAMIVVFAAALAIPAAPRAAAADASPGAVKAGFLYNFARFAEWPSLVAGASIAMCVVGDDEIANALTEMVHGQTISGHPLDVVRPLDSRAWRGCHLLFVADHAMRQFAAGKAAVDALPILTVSDGKGFSQAGGAIELYIDDGRMRFAINVEVAEHVGVHLSSRLLGLAKIVR